MNDLGKLLQPKRKKRRGHSGLTKKNNKKKQMQKNRIPHKQDTKKKKRFRKKKTMQSYSRLLCDVVPATCVHLGASRASEFYRGRRVREGVSK